MRNTFLNGVAMGALWIGIILLVIGLWLDTFILALVGMLIGGLFGLPAVYLLLDKDHFARQQVRQFLLGPRNRRQPATRSNTVIEGKLSESVTTSAIPADAIQIPVKVNVQTEPEKFEEVIAQKPVAPPKPAAVHVAVDILAEDTDEEMPVTTTPPEPPKPSEWDLQKQADAEYKQIKEEFEAVDPTDYDKLIDYLSHADARIRLAVVQRLRHLEDERVVSNLQQALDDDDAVVQRAARIALEEAEERSATDET